MSALEARVGRRFGDPADPLLVSVRSGAPRSMPGMMDTILNLGLNEATAERAGAGLRRRRRSPPTACGGSGRSTASIVGGEAPDDPWAQLRGAIEAVFRSWLSDRAVAYRRVEGIPDDLGTGVTVQAMVFGNRGADCGTGVLFTRNPATGEASLYGDVLFDAQGEDVVAGTHAPSPRAGSARGCRRLIDELRAARCDARAPLPRLLRHRVHDRAGPAVAAPGAGRQADAPGGAPDGGRDGRGPGVPAVARGGGAAGAADPRRAARRTPPRPGIGRRRSPSGSVRRPGVASGEIRLDARGRGDGGRRRSRRASSSARRPRRTTSSACAASAGVLTSHGGFASHAAVVARGWGIPAVVGAADVRGRRRVRDDRRASSTRVPSISIDGATGEVFDGRRRGRPEARAEASRCCLGGRASWGSSSTPMTVRAGPEPVDESAGRGRTTRCGRS